MMVVRGVAFVVACGVLFAVGGGLIAVMLNWLAPGYYPGVFPPAAREGSAVALGLRTGVLQGQILGLIVGVTIAVGLGWMRRFGWASAGRALAALLGCAAACGVTGGLIGWALGVFNPGYYRGVVIGGSRPDFNAIDVGIGLGSSQGLILGALLGALGVVALAWRGSRAGVPSAPRNSPCGGHILQESTSESSASHPDRRPAIWRGITIGLVVGVAWAAFGPLTDGPPSLWLSLAVYATGFAVTGGVVGAVGRFPELVGLSAGFLALTVLAVIVGPKDGWVVLWVLAFGGSGLLWGPVIGLLFRLFRPR
jgi:hypothetical protein